VDLSRRRAAAVVQMLVSQYHLAADRLQAYGAGPYARGTRTAKAHPVMSARVVHFVQQSAASWSRSAEARRFGEMIR
jgi:hypothetical protein